ncbi:LPS assembly lipoprotein LptE [Robbsia betulipollinis]|uniref:LPS-assembly lipoprotein LptE n=1 Tax=Robbsia betulipollinis TaxID=2981849 RepID=UPI003D79B165
MKKNLIRAMLVVVASLLLGACGFQLQGNHDYPFKRLYIAGGTPEMTAYMKRSIQGGSDTVVLDTPAGADATLTMVFGRGQSAISFNVDGVVQEYVLTATVNYKLTGSNGAELIPPSGLSVNRAMSYSDTYALAKQSEAVILNRDMDSDIADQILRRLAVVRTMDPAESTVPSVRSRAPLPTPPL